jgi:hypothetical protein
MPKVRKAGLDAATEQQAIASAQWLIKLRGGLSHEHSRDYWRFSTKVELCGQVDGGERFVQGIKDAFAKDGKVSISFLPGPGKWNEQLLAKLMADAKQGDADSDQVLRETAAGCLERGELLPKRLADYAATCLRAPSGRKRAKQQPNSSKPQSHKTDYRDWILALTIDDIVRHFKLNPALRHFKLNHTRNDATEEHCGCSIVSAATELHENTVQNAWHRYQDIADQRTEYVPQAVVTVTYDSPRSHLMRSARGRLIRRPRVVGSDGTQEHFLVRFPRVGSIEAVPQPKPQRSRKA